MALKIAREWKREIRRRFDSHNLANRETLEGCLGLEFLAFEISIKAHKPPALDKMLTLPVILTNRRNECHIGKRPAVKAN